MSIPEKLYSVEDLAKITYLSTRTIRNYLRDGLLTGRKIGGQWRFAEEDIEKFLTQGKVRSDMASEQRQQVLDFMDGLNSDVPGPTQICTIVDLYLPRPEVEDKMNAVCGIAEQCKGYMTFKYDYSDDEGRGRFLFFTSDPVFLEKAMAALKGKNVPDGSGA